MGIITKTPSHRYRSFGQDTQVVTEDYEAFNVRIKEEGDERDWLPSSRHIHEPVDEKDRKESVDEIRWLARRQGNMQQALRLYKSFVLGRNFEIIAGKRDLDSKVTKKDKKVVHNTTQVWLEFLRAHRNKWSPRELGVRTWRDGEQFSQLFPTTQWPPQVRFHDPEMVDDPNDGNHAGGENLGIITAPGDVSEPERYLIVDPKGKRLIGEVEADEMIHTKIDVDSTEKRGVSRFFGTRVCAKLFRQMVGNEVEMRNIQSSIVIHRKMKGGGTAISNKLDTLKTGTTDYPEGSMRREKIRRGTIVTTNHNVDIEFKQPDTNFTDATPLVKLLILQIASATGWPYYMVSADSADSNFAASLVQESPVNVMVQDEQDFFGGEIEPIWWFVMGMAIESGRLKGISIESLRKNFQPTFRFPTLATRDRLKEAQSDNIYFMSGGYSMQEMSRRGEVDPEQMRHEIEEEMEDERLASLRSNMSAANTPGQSSSDNNQGQNQGGGDKKGADTTQTARRDAQ